jgi:hypothetical protein
MPNAVWRGAYMQGDEVVEGGRGVHPQRCVAAPGLSKLDPLVGWQGVSVGRNDVAVGPHGVEAGAGRSESLAERSERLFESGARPAEGEGELLAGDRCALLQQGGLEGDVIWRGWGRAVVLVQKQIARTEVQASGEGEQRGDGEVGQVVLVAVFDSPKDAGLDADTVGKGVDRQPSRDAPCTDERTVQTDAHRRAASG